MQKTLLTVKGHLGILGIFGDDGTINTYECWTREVEKGDSERNDSIAYYVDYGKGSDAMGYIEKSRVIKREIVDCFANARNGEEAI